MGELHEKCGVVGVSVAGNYEDAVNIAHLGLHAIQHRGDESSGIVGMSWEGKFDYQIGLGEVKDVYTRKRLDELAGAAAIGHNRYPTSSGEAEHNQPILDETLEFGLGHNGTLSVVDDLEKILRGGNIDTKRLNDTEMMAHAIAGIMRRGVSLPDAIEELYPILHEFRTLTHNPA